MMLSSSVAMSFSDKRSGDNACMLICVVSTELECHNQ